MKNCFDNYCGRDRGGNIKSPFKSNLPLKFPPTTLIIKSLAKSPACSSNRAKRLAFHTPKGLSIKNISPVKLTTHLYALIARIPQLNTYKRRVCRYTHRLALREHSFCGSSFRFELCRCFSSKS